MTDFQQYFDESHQLIRDSVRRFVEREVLPHIDEWEEAEEFPRELYLKAGAAGILGIGYPEAYGGSCEGDLFAKVAASEELMRCGSGGLVAGLGSLDIGLPPVVKGPVPRCASGWCRRCCAARRSWPWRSPSPLAAPTWPT